MTSSIHPTALISKNAQIGLNVKIGPFVQIKDNVQIYDNCVIGAYTSIGEEPETIGFNDISKGVIINKDTVIREHVIIHNGSNSFTTIGSNCYISGHSYIAHDCEIGNHVTMNHGVLLSSFVKVMDYAVIGIGAAVHQRSTIGQYAMIAANAAVVKDVPPLGKFIPNKLLAINVYAIDKYDLTNSLLKDHYHHLSSDPRWDELWLIDGYYDLHKHFDLIRDKSRDTYNVY